MRFLMQWCIYYDNGSTFSDLDGTPEDAPGLGVVCIACRSSKCTQHKWDWYYWHAEYGQWWGSDIHGLLYQLCNDRNNHVRAVKQGAMVTTEFYQECMNLAFKART
jgi:hypothetical protein